MALVPVQLTDHVVDQIDKKVFNAKSKPAWPFLTARVEPSKLNADDRKKLARYKQQLETYKQGRGYKNRSEFVRAAIDAFLATPDKVTTFEKIEEPNRG